MNRPDSFDRGRCWQRYSLQEPFDPPVDLSIDDGTRLSIATVGPSDGNRAASDEGSQGNVDSASKQLVSAGSGHGSSDGRGGAFSEGVMP